MSRSKRKWDHIQHALLTGPTRLTGFDDVRFVHQSLPDSAVDQVRLNTKIGELELSSPFFINAMTGGGGEKTFSINRNLALAAKETGIALAVGSQMSAIKNPDEQVTYRIVREVNPNGVIIGNLGSEASPDQANYAIEMIKSDAIQIHLNTVQELTMPEGDRNFIGSLKRIEKIIKAVPVPVIIKEVGFGMSKETVSKLCSIGVSAIDIGGFGGTNFAEIENKRRERFLSFFNDWGIPTAVSIIEAKEVAGEIPIIGSGGVGNSLDVIKAIALGASAVGVAGVFLNLLMTKGLDTLIAEIQQLKEEITLLMTAIGASTVSDLQSAPVVLFGDTHHYLTERGIDTKKFSQRQIF